MSIIKYVANADTTITNAFKPNTTSRAFYANLGAADSLEIFSIAHSGSFSEKSRILLQFPIDKIIEDRSSGKIPASGSMEFVLKLYNVQHPETLPKNYQITVKPISGSWDEGYGLDLETYSDVGQTATSGFGVGWKFRSTTDFPIHWFSDGGDFWDGYDKTFYFENGTEDVDLNITDIVEAQINGTISKHGIGVMLSNTFEEALSGDSFYTKRFSARSTEYFFKKPSIEARWEALVKDDRGNFYFSSDSLSEEDNKQNIYFYNKIGGTYKNIPNEIIPRVKILDEDGQILIDTTSSFISTGVYKASVILTGSEDCELNDVWYSGSSTYFSGKIQATSRIFEDQNYESDYVVSITNLKNIYKPDEYANIKVFCRKKDWEPNIYKVATNKIDILTLNNLYYKVYRIVDKYTVLDYGIEPVAYTKCSYDKNGNYFNLDMSMFEPGYSYAIKLMTVENSIKKEAPGVFKFKVE